jgi:hypothetical protein
MNPFEDLIRALGNEMGISLKPDPHQSCRIDFSEDIWVQIDLDSTAERILLGSQLGQVTLGPYRERIFLQSLKVNGSTTPITGILAYSEKTNKLILFQFLLIATLNGAKLHHCVQSFLEHATIWIEAIKRGEVPHFELEEPKQSSGFFGLKR